MKSNESFTLTEVWWKAGKPALLLDTGLSKALRDYATADAKYKSQQDIPNYKALKAAILAVDKARLATIKQCGINPLLKDTKAALGRDTAISQRRAAMVQQITSVIEADVARIEGLLKDENEAAAKIERRINTLKTEIQKARDGSDGKKLLACGKILRSHVADAQITETVRVTNEVTRQMIVLKGIETDFPDQVDRLKKCKSGSDKNTPKIKMARMLELENKDIMRGDD